MSSIGGYLHIGTYQVTLKGCKSGIFSQIDIASAVVITGNTKIGKYDNSIKYSHSCTSSYYNTMYLLNRHNMYAMYLTCEHM